MLPEGTKVAGFVIERELGRGGMGIVYEANQTSLNRKVALKLLDLQATLDPSFKERFRHEGRIQAAIDHPSIVPIYEAGEYESGLYIAMRLVRGSNLKDLIATGQLDGPRTLMILAQIADALDTSHEAGLIHRDIKPQNILVGAHDRAYLADFGLTKSIDGAGLTLPGQFVGTIDYMPPEQIRGEAATGRTDVYALAAVLYECLTGVIPYPKSSDAAVMYAQVSEPPPLVTDQRPELPPALDDVICRGMAKDPGERHVGPGELVRDAERALGRPSRPVAAQPPPAAETVAAPSIPRRRTAAAPDPRPIASPALPTEKSPAVRPSAPASATAPAPETVMSIPAVGAAPDGRLPAPGDDRLAASSSSRSLPYQAAAEPVDTEERTGPPLALLVGAAVVVLAILAVVLLA